MKMQQWMWIALWMAGAQAAQGAGFEKSVMWSGKEAGYAGAGVGYITGSQSIASNPAGLAAPGDVSLNVSPSWIALEGSITSAATTYESRHNFSPPGGLTASYRLNDQFAFGVGAYVAGGSKAIFDTVNLSESSAAVTAFKPRIATDFRVMEYALGGAYELAPGWRIGAAWRIVQATGGLSTVKKSNTTFSYIDISEAKDTKYNGFRLGVQYEAPGSAWGYGVAFRNGVSFAAQGKMSATVITLGNAFATVPFSTEATVGTSLPYAISAGGHYAVSDGWRLLAGVDYVNYKKNVELKITGTLNSVALPNIPLNWENMWNFRVGTEYALSALTLRAGYSLTTRVTSETDARATLTPPGKGHLFTVGAGTKLMDNLDLDGAFEYAFNSGSGSMTNNPGAAAAVPQELLAGVSTKYKATTVAIHTGLTYRF